MPCWIGPLDFLKLHRDVAIGNLGRKYEGLARAFRPAGLHDDDPDHARLKCRNPCIPSALIVPTRRRPNEQNHDANRQDTCEDTWHYYFFGCCGDARLRARFGVHRSGRSERLGIAAGALSRQKLRSGSGLRAALPRTALRLEHRPGQVESGRRGAVVSTVRQLALDSFHGLDGEYRSGD